MQRSPELHHCRSTSASQGMLQATSGSRSLRVDAAGISITLGLFFLKRGLSPVGEGTPNPGNTTSPAHSQSASLDFFNGYRR